MIGTVRMFGLAVIFAVVGVWAQDITWNGAAPSLTPGAPFGQYYVKIEAGATGTLNVEGGWHVMITSDELIDLGSGKLGINFANVAISSAASVNWTAQVTGSATSGGVVEVTNPGNSMVRDFNINGGLIQSTGAGGTAVLAQSRVSVTNAEVKATGVGGNAITINGGSYTPQSDVVMVYSGMVSATTGTAIHTWENAAIFGGTVRVTTGTAIFASSFLRIGGHNALVIGQNPVFTGVGGLLNKNPQVGHNNGFIISYDVGGGTYGNGSAGGIQVHSPNSALVNWAIGPGGAGGIRYGSDFIEIEGVTITIPELEWNGNSPPTVTVDSRVKINAGAGGGAFLDIPDDVTVIIVSDGSGTITTGGAINIYSRANSKIIWEAKIDRALSINSNIGDDAIVDIEAGAEMRGLNLNIDGIVNINGGLISGGVSFGFGTTITLNVYDGVTISSSGFAISGNGGSIINISGGVISSSNVAIYSDGIINVSGGIISSTPVSSWDDGILSYGEFNMSGGLVISTRKPVSNVTSQTGGAIVRHDTWPGAMVLDGGTRHLTITPGNADVYWTKTPSAGIKFGDLFVPVDVIVADPIDVSDKIVFNSSSKDYAGRHLWVDPAAFDPSFDEGQAWALSYKYEAIDEAGNENASVTWRPWSSSTPEIMEGYYPLTAGRYKVTVTYDDYEITTGTKEAVFTINKLVVQLKDIFPPTATGITYGEKVSDSDLEDGMTGGTWAWHNDDRDIVPGVGSLEFRAVFTPTDNDNYDWDAIDDGVFEVELTVNPKELTITGVSAVNRNYEAGNVTVELTGGSLVGVVSGDNVGFNLGNGTMVNANAGTNKAVTTDITLTGADEGNYTLTQPAGIMVTIGTVAVLSPERFIPNLPQNKEEFAPVTVFAGELIAGPNPVAKPGVVKFFWQGKRIESALLTIFDASGNLVNRVKIKDADDNNNRRIVGSWDLTDRKGRIVSEGTYLVRGVITVDGKKERVSLLIGVR